MRFPQNLPLRRSVLRICALFALLSASGCNGQPSDVREWAASDHDQAEGQGQTVAPRPAGESPSAANDPALIDLAWQRNCSKCHGPQGRGDGPEGPMVRSPDLTRAEWQEKVTDDEIAQTIRKGRNKMPAFDLPPAVLEGLVARIRKNGGR